jgi:hypothetical protein
MKTVYRDAVLATSPIAYWRLGEELGVVMHAEVGTDGYYNYAPTLGATGLLVGDTDSAVTFPADGNANAISTDAAVMAVLNGGTGHPFTIAVWMNIVTPDSTFRRVFDTDDGSASLVSYESCTIPGAGGVFYYAEPLPTGTHFVVMDFDGITTLRVFVDNIRLSPIWGTTDQITPIANTATFLSIGNSFTGLFPINGTLDEIAIWDRVLSGTERAILYTIGNDGSRYSLTVFATNPIGYWRLGDTSGEILRSAIGGPDGWYYANWGSPPTLGVPGLIAGDTDTAISLAGLDSSGSVARTDDAAVLALLCGGAGHPWTFAEWVNISAPDQAFRRLFETGGATVRNVGIESYVACLIADCSGGYFYANPISTGTHFVRMTYDGATTLRLYVDEVEFAPIWGGNNTVSDVFTDTFDMLVFGGDPNGNNKANGVVDEPAVWDRVLSATEGAMLYAVGKGTALGVRRSNVWTDGAVKVRRSGAWVAPTSIKIRRGGVWTTVT